MCTNPIIFTHLKVIRSIIIVLAILSFGKHIVAQENNSLKEPEKRSIFHLSGNTLTDSLDIVPYVHIILKNKNWATASDIHGYFNFPAEVNDTLLFTAIGYDMITMVVKDTFGVEYPYLEIFMHQDTIQLAELVIRPWHGNYARFKQALLDFEPPETDLDRAYKNLAIMDLHSLLYNSPATPSIAFRNTMKMYNDKLYWAGQMPPISITNPLAWAQFFKALKNGDLKRK